MNCNANLFSFTVDYCLLFTYKTYFYFIGLGIQFMINNFYPAFSPFRYYSFIHHILFITRRYYYIIYLLYNILCDITGFVFIVEYALTFDHEEEEKNTEKI